MVGPKAKPYLPLTGKVVATLLVHCSRLKFTSSSGNMALHSIQTVLQNISTVWYCSVVETACSERLAREGKSASRRPNWLVQRAIYNDGAERVSLKLEARRAPAADGAGTRNRKASLRLQRCRCEEDVESRAIQPYTWQAPVHRQHKVPLC